MAGWTVHLLLMVILSPALGQTPFTVRAAQDVYQAEEHSNITLTWLLPANADTSDSLVIDIMFVTRPASVYSYDSRSEDELHPDQAFRGRVRCGPVLARTGRIECVFLDVRLNDTGEYKCYVDVIGKYRSSKPCQLNVTESSRNRPTDDPSEAVGRGRTGLWISAGLVLLVAAALVVRCCLSAGGL